MKVSKAKELIAGRKFPGDYFEMDGIIKNHEADLVALQCIDKQLQLKKAVDNWNFNANSVFPGEMVLGILKEFVVEDDK